MGCGMGRPKVKKHNLGVDILHGSFIDTILFKSGSNLFFHTVGLQANLPLFNRVIFAERMTFELPVIENSSQVRMALEVDTVLVIYFPFTPVG